MINDASEMKFISIVESFFPRPKFSGDDKAEAVWLRTMREILAVYDEDVLIEAAKTIIRTRDPDKDGTMFPKPVECIAACNKAKELKCLRAAPLLETADKVRERLEKNNHAAWREDRVQLAIDLCKGELGQRAAREGWMLALYDFCRNNMRLPRTSTEITTLIDESRAYRTLVERLRGETTNDIVVNALARLGETVLGRGREISEKVLSGDAA